MYMKHSDDVHVQCFTDVYFAHCFSQEVAHYFGDLDIFAMVPGRAIHWPNNRGPPPNYPRCGFNGNDLICIQTGSF